MKLRKMTLTLLLILFLAGCAQNPAENSEIENPDTEMTEEAVDEEGSTEEEVVEEVDENDTEEEAKEEIPKELTELATGLEIPWEIVKHGEEFYITNRPGYIVKVADGETIRQEVELERQLSFANEAGMLGLVLDPDFSNNQEAIAYYTYSSQGGPLNRIVRLKNEGNTWREIEVLLDEIPSGVVHHGGRIKIGPDGKLYATAGDAYNQNLPQNLNSIAGKILRMNLDGSIPEDNPFPDSYVYTYGHRNAQGLTWMEDGRMYASEHGNQANDEINLIEAGNNYGWPVIEGMQERAEMITPVFTSGSDNTWAPSGMANYGNKLYVAALRGNAILEFDLETEEVRTLMTEYGRIRDVMIEGEFLYFITNNTDGRGNPREGDDKLYRIGLSELE